MSFGPSRSLKPLGHRLPAYSNLSKKGITGLTVWRRGQLMGLSGERPRSLGRPACRFIRRSVLRERYSKYRSALMFRGGRVGSSGTDGFCAGAAERAPDPDWPGCVTAGNGEITAVGRPTVLVPF